MLTTKTMNRGLIGLAISMFALTGFGAAHAAVVYQQDFNSYTGFTYAADVGWAYSTTYGSSSWGQIQDQGTGTGPCLWAISGWTHPFTTSFTGNETLVVVKSLIWTQAGGSSAGLYSQPFSAFNGTANWSGFGPQMAFDINGNFSLRQAALDGGASSSAVPVSGASAGNANFSMVIDVTTGLADAYFGSPETGTLLVNDFDLKGTSNLATWKANLLANNTFGVYSNQGLFDNISVTTTVPEPASLALLGLSAGVLLRRRR